jgi:hypothetical protein
MYASLAQIQASLAPQYLVEREINRGGAAVVYLAHAAAAPAHPPAVRLRGGG